MQMATSGWRRQSHSQHLHATTTTAPTIAQPITMLDGGYR